MMNDQNGKWQASGEKNSLNMPQPDNALSQLEMFHIELTGVCTDDDRQDFTLMMKRFATKFKGFVDLAPFSQKKIETKA